MAVQPVESLSTPNPITKREIALAWLVSLLLLMPCVWHRHIQAGDVASHLYNAWLAQLVGEGKAPGVYLVWQYKNVLFDLMLLHLGKMFGFSIAEKIAVGLCVLVFFWGVFTLATVEAGRRPWFLVPGLGMLAYGYVFTMGFMNFYLSLGLACFALAALWRGSLRGVVMAIALALAVMLAHPLGCLWLLAAGAYRLLWPKVKGWMEWLLPGAAVGIALAVRWVLLRHPEYQTDWPDTPVLQWNGADQFWIFRPETRYVAAAIALFVLSATLFDLVPWKRDERSWKERRLFLEFYAVSFLLTTLLPENLRPDPSAGWVGLLVSRLTLIGAIFAFCWVATLRPKAWHVVALTGIAVVFFAFAYQGTALAERVETSAETLTRQLPFGTRVLASIWEPPDYRMGTLHVADRACIGHCFVYSNYEPATKQFRVRVNEGSPVVTASPDDSEDMQFGSYDVQDEDLPLKQIYQCDSADWTKLCIRDLRAGEKNGAGAAHPN